MSDILRVHIFHPFEYLLHKLAYFGHRYVFLILLALLYDLLEVSPAELKYEILRSLPLIVL